MGIPQSLSLSNGLFLASWSLSSESSLALTLLASLSDEEADERIFFLVGEILTGLSSSSSSSLSFLMAGLEDELERREAFWRFFLVDVVGRASLSSSESVTSPMAANA